MRRAEHDVRQPARHARRPRRRSSTSPSPWPRSCARSWPSCARWPATRARRCATSRALVRSPGADNDLIELTKSAVPLRDVAVGAGQAQRQGARRRASRPRPRRSRRRRPSSRPRARTRPTSPAGSTTSATPGLYDALGGASRAAPVRQRCSRPSTACSSRCSTRRAARQALQARRPRWTSAGAARARSSAARPASRRADFPCDASEGPLGP